MIIAVVFHENIAEGSHYVEQMILLPLGETTFGHIVNDMLIAANSSLALKRDSLAIIDVETSTRTRNYL